MCLRCEGWGFYMGQECECQTTLSTPKTAQETDGSAPTAQTTPVLMVGHYRIELCPDGSADIHGENGHWVHSDKAALTAMLVRKIFELHARITA